MNPAAFISPLLLAACASPETAGLPVPLTIYEGIETNWLDEDLVQLTASLRGAETPEAVVAYARCAAARTAVGRGYGFARHLRTNVYEKGGVWSADAVYTISPSLPSGLETIDAEVTVQACTENGIPLV